MSRPTKAAGPTPKTNAGKALVEWAQIAAPNQIDVWREHAVLIEAEAYGLGIRMVKPDIEAQEALYTAERVTHAYQQGRRDIFALPPSDPPVLDVERLALALVIVTRPLYAGENVDDWRYGTAERIAAEYARLSAQPEDTA